MKKTSWPLAFVFSATMIASAIVFAALNTAESQQRASGFMVASAGAQYVWRVNTSTGAVSYCARRDGSVDPAIVTNRAPYCSPSTGPAE